MKMQQRSPDPFFWEGDQTGLLLIHGFTGTTAELRAMGKFFHDKGMTVHAPLLAGHGTSPEDMALTTWKDWWCSAVEGYKKLVNHGCTSIFAAGLSMGGLLALNIAYNYELKGVISMCTPVYIRDRRVHFIPLIKRMMPYAKREGEKLPHIEKEIYSYERTPVCCVESLLELIKMVKKRMPEITAPVFIAQSEQDETVNPKSASYIYDHIGSQYKVIEWYPESSHIITLDKERDTLFRDVGRFIREIETEQ